jgi:hypothetical protein
VRANVLARWNDDLIGEFAACGDGWIRERQTTYTFKGERGRVHVDYRATWYVKDRCPATHGVARIQIDLAEECWCPEGGHCHGRYDEDCVPYD